MSQSAETGTLQTAPTVAKTVDMLRQVCAPLTARLSPEVEPATAYRLQPPAEEFAAEAQPPVDLTL
jgi:hypothetical protein